MVHHIHWLLLLLLLLRCSSVEGGIIWRLFDGMALDRLGKTGWLRWRPLVRRIGKSSLLLLLEHWQTPGGRTHGGWQSLGTHCRPVALFLIDSLARRR